MSTETFDSLLVQWLSDAPRLPRRERQKVLLKEFITLHTLGRAELLEGKAADVQATQEREVNVLTVLRRSLAEAVDAASILRVSELLTSSTDLDVLYNSLDPECILLLYVDDDQPSRRPYIIRGVDDVVNELCEFQESVLRYRCDLASSSSSTRSSGSANPVAVRGVSTTTSWVKGFDVEVEVATRIVYYVDRSCTTPLAELWTTFLFAPDALTVERVERHLCPSGLYTTSDVLCAVYFTGFS